MDKEILKDIIRDKITDIAFTAIGVIGLIFGLLTFAALIKLIYIILTY